MNFVEDDTSGERADDGRRGGKKESLNTKLRLSR